MYTTIAKFKSALKREFDSIYSNDAGVVDETLAVDDLTAAAAAIDGKINVRYAIPVIAPESLPLLESWNLTLAKELAYARSEGTTIPEKIKTLADAVRNQLDAIADGDRKLPGAARENSKGVGAVSIVSSSKPIFKREQMRGF